MYMSKLHKDFLSHYSTYSCTSGVAIAFPIGQAAHPEDQIEEENEEAFKKNRRK